MQKAPLTKLLCVLSTAVLLCVATGRAASSRESTSVAVVFSPTGEARRIHAAITQELGRARRGVDLAIFNFTSRRLSKALIATARRCRVRVLFDERSAKHISISQHKELVGQGIQIRMVRLPGSGVRAAKFHHKFCVIDKEEVLTGSYNWTVSADEVNYENLVILRDRRIAGQFSAEFERIWKNAKIAVPLEQAR
jgi:phospholipase D